MHALIHSSVRIRGEMVYRYQEGSPNVIKFSLLGSLDIEVNGFVPIIPSSSSSSPSIPPKNKNNSTENIEYNAARNIHVTPSIAAILSISVSISISSALLSFCPFVLSLT
jgi:hypothetical protein